MIVPFGALGSKRQALSLRTQNEKAPHVEPRVDAGAFCRVGTLVRGWAGRRQEGEGKSPCRYDQGRSGEGRVPFLSSRTPVPLPPDPREHCRGTRRRVHPRSHDLRSALSLTVIRFTGFSPDICRSFSTAPNTWASPANSALAITNNWSAERKSSCCPGAPTCRRPQSTKTSASAAGRHAPALAISRSSAHAASALTGPTSASRPPGRCCKWEEGITSPRAACRVDRTRLVIPVPWDNVKRAARSPPEGSHSAMTTRRSVGQTAPNAHSRVVTPGEPFAEQNAKTVTIPAPRRPERSAQRQRRWPQREPTSMGPAARRSSFQKSMRRSARRRR